MASFDKKELKKIAGSLKAQFNVGKNGVTETFIETIDKYLEVHGIVKIKSSVAEDKDALKEMAKEVADAIEAEIVDVRGYTFTLAR